MSRGILYVVAAPSGAGKTSLVNALLERVKNIVLSISFTTRPKRPKEVNGVNYHFVDKLTFEDMIGKSIFLEHAEVFGNYYGTAQTWVEKQLVLGNDVILEIDWQGAQQVRHLFPETIGIFILPPSLKTLRERLEKRDQDTTEVIERRIALARTEISHCREFDYLIVNNNFETALADLDAIVRARRHTVAFQTENLAKLLTDLLA